MDKKQIQAFCAELAQNLKKTGEVRIHPLGIFRVKSMPARKGRNPKTGTVIQIPARKKLSLRFSTTFKKEVLE